LEFPELELEFSQQFPIGIWILVLRISLKLEFGISRLGALHFPSGSLEFGISRVGA